MNRVIVTGTVTLSHIIREDVILIGDIIPLAPSNPNSEQCILVEVDLAERVSHDYPLFKDDNAKSHYYLEESVRSSQCVA